MTNNMEVTIFRLGKKCVNKGIEARKYCGICFRKSKCCSLNNEYDMKNVNTNYFSNLLAYGGRDIENQFWVLAAEITEAALTHLRKRSFFSSHMLPHRKTATAPSITCPKAVRDSQDIENYL